MQPSDITDAVSRIDDATMTHKEYEEKNGYITSRPGESLLGTIDKPKYYQIFPEHNLEAMDIILRVIQLSGLNGRKAYLLGNALKYLLRIGRKGRVKEDAGKARHYCKRIEDE